MSEYTSQARGRLYSESGASTMFSHKGTSQICLGRAARARVARTDVYGKAVSWQADGRNKKIQRLAQ